MSLSINKCSGSCNAINNPYSKLCVPDKIKDINMKVFYLTFRKNETGLYHDKNHVNVNVDYMQVFLMTNSVRVMINADVKSKNLLIKLDLMMGLYEILVHMNVINHMM